jgi:hypothetical protein
LVSTVLGVVLGGAVVVLDILDDAAELFAGALTLYAFPTIRHASFDYYGPMHVVGYDVNIVRD